ncbi:MAG: CDP-glucose 4,6-dehydratase [Verrucomicrobia bacterium]|nr:CDP-glucose 4,6-dehydratase [Verrucomicrobiota bacterium]
MFNGYYAGKRVLVTGHSGFKGAWLSLWLEELGATVCGAGLPAPTRPNLYSIVRSHAFSREILGDIRDPRFLQAALRKARPEAVFHLAAQACVRASYRQPRQTVETNVMGTAHLLEAIRLTGFAGPVVIVTSDKCYENIGREIGFRENDPLGGHDVYSASKAACEILTHAWRRSFFSGSDSPVRIATARGGNVIGGGDYAPDRIVPDCIRALMRKDPIAVRSPESVRPWQHVLDCLSGYLWLGACLASAPSGSPLASPFNFGPGPGANRPVRELVEALLRHWPGQWRDASDPRAPHEAIRLNIAIDKAVIRLRWLPTWTFDETVCQTAVWYRARHAERRPDLLSLSRQQIAQFTQAAAAQNAAWTRSTVP